MACNLDTIRKYLKSAKHYVLINDIADNFSIKYWNQKQGYKIHNPQLLEHYYAQRYFVITNNLERKLIIISDPNIFCTPEIENFPLEQIFVINKNNFDDYLAYYTADYNTTNAINYLQNNPYFHSAKILNYEKMVTGFITIFFSLMYFYSNVFNIITGLFYLIQNCLKSSLFVKGLKSDLTLLAVQDHQNITNNDNLPIYSILVPLYQEELKIESILKAIGRLNYPAEKLDVKFILEEDDVLTNQAITSLKTPSYLQVIKVPYSLPRTKPKALNYAMPFVRGEYLTIYDAEDEPEPEQLMKALQAFAVLPENYVCVQARLNFYNAHKNLLTRLFSVEYNIWFGYLLRGLSLLELPVPLGGTSNHFKVIKLKEAGLWDAYNVTEDADLGIRLYLQGYKIYMIDSITMEEAPDHCITWIGQRARWIKGFIQTIGVFMKTDINYNIFSMQKVLVVYIFMGLSVYNFIFLPWLLMIIFMALHVSVYYFWVINSILGLCYMYITAYLAISSKDSLVKLNNPYHYLVLFIWPLYFILHSIAAYRALWELVKAPFKWNKTPHGNYEELKNQDHH
ncbi:MAG: glycosyltransferase [Rickettsiaceae bacterium]|nr:glycosyltransferase [Rickettsiaceae bacterium]